MNTLVDKAKKAYYSSPLIIIKMESGVEVRFPAKENPRLAKGTPAQLNNVEISPFGLHWPDLDEDLSFDGLLRGDFGQSQKLSKGSGMNGANLSSVLDVFCFFDGRFLLGR